MSCSRYHRGTWSVSSLICIYVISSLICICVMCQVLSRHTWSNSCIWRYEHRVVHQCQTMALWDRPELWFRLQSTRSVNILCFFSHYLIFFVSSLCLWSFVVPYRLVTYLLSVHDFMLFRSTLNLSVVCRVCVPSYSVMIDEQFLQFSGLVFVTLDPFHCA